MVVFHVTLGQLVSPGVLLHLFQKRTSWITGMHFWRQDVLPVTQPSVSVHWWEHKALTLTSGLASSFFIHHQTPDGRGVAPFTLALWCHLLINDVWLLPKQFYVGSQQKKLTNEDDDRTTTTSRERILVLKSVQFFLLASCTLLTLFLCILAQLTNAFFLNVETVMKQLLEHLPYIVVHHITLYTASQKSPHL